MENSFFLLEDSIYKLSGELKEYVTSTFLKLKKEKMKEILLAICSEASTLSNPLELNIKEVAKRGGVAVGSLYKYFTNRENMISYTVELVKSYIIKVMGFSLTELLKLNFRDALIYYVKGSQYWSDEEKAISYFFYQAAYCGDKFLSEKIVKPVSKEFIYVIRELVVKAQKSDELSLYDDVDTSASFIYRSLLSIADSGIYPTLGCYYFPEGCNEEDLYQDIERIIRAVGVVNGKGNT